jgi:hypothetical protein
MTFNKPNSPLKQVVADMKSRITGFAISLTESFKPKNK